MFSFIQSMPYPLQGTIQDFWQVTWNFNQSGSCFKNQFGACCRIHVSLYLKEANPKMSAVFKKTHLWPAYKIYTSLRLLSWSATALERDKKRIKSAYFMMSMNSEDFKMPITLCVCVCVCMCTLSHVWLFVTPWIVAWQPLLYMGFPRQEYWSGLPFPPLEIFPTQGSNPCLLRWQVGSLPLSHQGSPSLANQMPVSQTHPETVSDQLPGLPESKDVDTLY